VELVYFKAEPLTLAQAGHDERWLQDRIEEDPAILGLGDVNLVERERRQSPGGRIDFLLKDPETETMYEVEVMLGRTNESHIIRTIEYWDVERRRWPTREHRAVIVAEEITNRFFNVIALFNRAIPMIAIQVNVFRVENRLVLDFTKVLDIYEPAEDEEGLSEPADRGYWERRSTPQSIGIFDRCLEMMRDAGATPRVAYNKGAIALSGSKQTFARFWPRKAHCLMRIRLTDADRENVAGRLEEAGITPSVLKSGVLSLHVTRVDLDQNGGAVRDALMLAWDTIGEGTSQPESDE
jgi:hypothetical protein